MHILQKLVPRADFISIFISDSFISMALVVFEPVSVSSTVSHAISLASTPSYKPCLTMVQSVLGMSLDLESLSALEPVQQLALRTLSTAFKAAFKDFGDALVESDNETTSEELEAAILKHRGLFMPFMESLLRSDRGSSSSSSSGSSKAGDDGLDAFLKSIDHDVAWTESTALVVALNADPRELGGDFKAWLLDQAPDVFARFWLDANSFAAPRTATRLAKAEATVTLFETDIRRISLHAAQLLSGYPEFRAKIDTDCPNLSKRVKTFLKRSLCKGAVWDRQDEEQERWFMNGKLLDEDEEENTNEDESKIDAEEAKDNEAPSATGKRKRGPCPV